MFNWLAKRRAPRKSASALYGRIVAQSRLAEFYKDFNVPDTVEGRFELLALHMFIVLETLRRQGAGGDPVARCLVDAFFADMDTSMRELGVGDMAVPKRMRKLSAAFYERLNTYRGAAESPASLANTIQDHIFGGVRTERAQALASYALQALAEPQNLAIEALLGGRVEFPDPGVALIGKAQ